MPDASEKIAQYYEDFSEKLTHDISKLQQDCQFISEGGDIDTAIDFSEIYSYCFQTTASFLSNFGENVFSASEDRAVLNALHDSILQHCLFSGDQELWLLYPYKIELRSFVVQLKELEQSKKYRLLPAYTEIDEARKKTGYDGLKALADEIKISDRPLSLEEAELIYKFLVDYAPSLSKFSQRPEENVPEIRARLAEIFARKKVVLPNNISERFGGGDEEVYEYWLKKLNKKRTNKFPNNDIDARVIAIIYAINNNSYSSERPRKLVLFSRSEVLNSIAETDSKRWSNVGGNPIRHPRGTLAMIGQNAQFFDYKDYGLPQVLKRSALKFQSYTQVNNTINQDRSRKSRSTNILKNVTRNEFINRQVALIKHAWRKFSEVNVVLLSMQKQRAKEDNLKASLQFLTNKDLFKSYLHKMLNKADDNIKMHSVLLESTNLSGLDEALELRGPSDPTVGDIDKMYADQAVLAENAVLEAFEVVKLMTSHKTYLPFSIYTLYAPGFNVLDEWYDDPFGYLATLTTPALTFFRQIHIGENDRDLVNEMLEVEWAILLSYALSSIGAWSGVKSTLEYFTYEKRHKSIEAELLMAKAARHIDGKDCTKLKHAIDRFEGTMASWPEGISRRLRFDSELIKLKLILIENKADCSNSDIIVDELKGLYSYIESLLNSYGGSKHETLDLAGEGICDLHNNYIYHSLNLRPHTHNLLTVEKIKKLTVSFERLLHQTYGENSDLWPDNYWDTLSWARFFLISDENRQGELDVRAEKLRILKPLIRLSRLQYASQSDKVDFRNHKTEVENFFTVRDEEL